MEISQSTDPCTQFGARTSPALPASSASNAAHICDLVTVPARQGLEAVDILRRGAGDGVGPVLHDDGCDTLGFLVPPGTAAAWDVPGSTCTETNGRGLSLAVPDSVPLSRVRTGCSRPGTRTWPPTRRCSARPSVRRPGSSRPPTTGADLARTSYGRRCAEGFRPPR